MRRWDVIGLAASVAAVIQPLVAHAQQSWQADTPAAIVQLQVAAFNSSDVDAFASFYADDIELVDLGPENKPSLSGQPALLARYAPMLSK